MAESLVEQAWAEGVELVGPGGLLGDLTRPTPHHHQLRNRRPGDTGYLTDPFNEERLHGELDDATPAEVEAARYRHLGQTNAA